MFTGLVQGAGQIAAMERKGQECRLTISTSFSLADATEGESIAVNGACLSVERFTSSQFVAYASAETMQRTNLKFLSQGAQVNLERALRVGDRLGGHIVSGHVDCLATVQQVHNRGESLVFTFSYPREFAGQVIAKGSICLDGISLTINTCETRGSLETFTVNVIPDTRKRTTVRLWESGHLVNMETDVLGKYVQRQLACGQGAASFATSVSFASGSTTTTSSTTTSSAITREFLLENGFL